VLMSEPDHIWLRPMPNLMKGRRPAAFPFFYIGDSSEIPQFRCCIRSFVLSDLQHGGWSLYRAGA
jgi:hypothetical protein